MSGGIPVEKPGLLGLLIKPESTESVAEELPKEIQERIRKIEEEYLKRK
jgi:hypothetical protein